MVTWVNDNGHGDGYGLNAYKLTESVESMTLLCGKSAMCEISAVLESACGDEDSSSL